MRIEALDKHGRGAWSQPLFLGQLHHADRQKWPKSAHYVPAVARHVLAVARHVLAVARHVPIPVGDKAPELPDLRKGASLLGLRHFPLFP